jgi:hypothetical protein
LSGLHIEPARARLRSIGAKVQRLMPRRGVVLLTYLPQVGEKAAANGSQLMRKS